MIYFNSESNVLQQIEQNYPIIIEQQTYTIIIYFDDASSRLNTNDTKAQFDRLNRH